MAHPLRPSFAPAGANQFVSRIPRVPLIRRGGIPQILTRPLLFDMNLRRPFQFAEIVAAKSLFDASFEKQMTIYADAGFRTAFKQELTLGRKWTHLARNAIVVSVENPALKQYEGSTVGQIHFLCPHHLG